MITPKTTTLFELELNDHAGPESLDAIATRVYGRPYKGQQTGDMLPNDSWHVYPMEQEDVDQWVFDMQEKRHYLGGHRVDGEWTAEYVEGVNWFDYWLALDWKRDRSLIPLSNDDRPHPPQEWEDARGFMFEYDFQVYRQAPTINYVLSDLIKRGELPYGTYLLHCWW